MTVFRQISISDTASFLTHLWYLIHFRDISKFDLTYFWQNFVTDRFQTLIWHISDSFLTDFCNWQFSDTYQTHFWHISEIYGTHTSQEYQVFSARDWDGRRDADGTYNLRSPGLGVKHITLSLQRAWQNHTLYLCRISSWYEPWYEPNWSCT